MKIAFAGVANETASQCEGCGDLMLALSGLILAYNGCRAEAATAQQQHSSSWKGLRQWAQKAIYSLLGVYRGLHPLYVTRHHHCIAAHFTWPPPPSLRPPPSSSLCAGECIACAQPLPTCLFVRPSRKSANSAKMHSGRLC